MILSNEAAIFQFAACLNGVLNRNGSSQSSDQNSQDIRSQSRPVLPKTECVTANPSNGLLGKTVVTLAEDIIRDALLDSDYRRF